jgi:hypothetical protein
MTAIAIAQQAVSDTGVVCEGLCALSLLVTGNARRLPFVFIYLGYQCLSDASLLMMSEKTDIWPALAATTYIGYLVEALAIWELAYRLFHDSTPRLTPLKRRIFGLGVIVSALAAALLTYLHGYSDFASAQQRLLLVDEGVSIFRVLIFLMILPFLRSRSSGRNVVVARVIFAFAVYAFCGLLNQIVDESAPSLALPAGTFEWANCICGSIWVVLLIVLSWQVLHCVAASPKLQQASRA